ncbi:MAG TPA: hypothetical protein VGT98_08515, partial [Candidatus Elarobacter sp.]|nr:hypothetical protein [Candidatus Elarobacter sp.]
MIRLGVVGHRGYPELPAILATLFRDAAALGAELYFESDLFEVANGGKRLTTPSDIDVAVSLG